MHQKAGNKLHNFAIVSCVYTSIGLNKIPIKEFQFNSNSHVTQNRTISLFYKTTGRIIHLQFFVK